MIFPPTSEDDPAYWSAVFAGHVWVGVALCAVLVWADLPPYAAPILYLAVWECMVQRVGAGWKDALTDTWAVALGAGTIWAAWEQIAPALAVSIVLAIISVWVGIWRRI
jgi:hypothetical protein